MEEQWTDAIKEAYNMAPMGIIIHPTLELRHESWVTPVRIVCDTVDLSAKIEDSGYQGGTTQTFMACAFEVIPPESSDKLPEITISIDNVSHIISEQIDVAMTVRAPIEITYREYLNTDPLSGPHYVLNRLTIRRITVNEKNITGTATFGDFINRAFPRQLFNTTEFPGLMR